MIDPFDEAFDEPAPAPAPMARVYATVPEGQVEVEVVAASMGTVPWKVCDANPTGEVIRLRLSAGHRYGFIFDDVPTHLGWLIRVIGDAVGLAENEVTPERLIGLRANVEIKHFTKRDGATKASVGKWLRHPDAPPRAAKASKPKASPKATAYSEARERASKDAQTIRARRPDLPSGKPQVAQPISDDDFPF
jgi:hypothetical protein